MTTLAADIGGTKIAAARVADDGTVTDGVLLAPTPAGEGADAVIDTVIELLRELSAAGATAVGISSAGVVDTSTGRITGSTDTIAGWRGALLGPRVSSALSLPVTVLGDGHAFAVGAATYGAAAGSDSTLVLAIGTGIGGSFVRHGQPLFGSHWAAGHLGHAVAPGAEGVPCSCGRTGHLESIAGGAGMVRWYHWLSGRAPVSTTEQIFERAEADPVARRVVLGAANAIGGVAGGLANTLDPAVVVIAGGMARVGGLWRSTLLDAYTRALMPVIAGTPLIISETDEWLALRGAAHFAKGAGHGR